MAIYQGESGEQRDALMPALFYLALKPALSEINARLFEECFAIAFFDYIYVISDLERAIAYDITNEILQRTCHIDVNVGKLAT